MFSSFEESKLLDIKHILKDLIRSQYRTNVCIFSSSRRLYRTRIESGIRCRTNQYTTFQSNIDHWHPKGVTKAANTKHTGEYGIVVRMQHKCTDLSNNIQAVVHQSSVHQTIQNLDNKDHNGEWHVAYWRSPLRSPLRCTIFTPPFDMAFILTDFLRNTRCSYPV